MGKHWAAAALRVCAEGRHGQASLHPPPAPLRPRQRASLPPSSPLRPDICHVPRPPAVAQLSVPRSAWGISGDTGQPLPGALPAPAPPTAAQSVGREVGSWSRHTRGFYVLSQSLALSLPAAGGGGLCHSAVPAGANFLTGPSPWPSPGAEVPATPGTGESRAALVSQGSPGPPRGQRGTALRPHLSREAQPPPWLPPIFSSLSGPPGRGSHSNTVCLLCKRPRRLLLPRAISEGPPSSSSSLLSSGGWSEWKCAAQSQLGWVLGGVAPGGGVHRRRRGSRGREGRGQGDRQG